MTRISKHRNEMEWQNFLLIMFIGVPLALTAVGTVIAGCFTVIWHVGHWVGWW